MAILVIAEHDNIELINSTRSTITAASQLGGEIHLLIAGNHAQSVVKIAQTFPQVHQVIYAEAPYYAECLPENLAPLVTKIATSYTHIFAPASSFGKNLLPRVAALLDMGLLSDVVAIQSTDTFTRPIYAGNALATLQSHDPIRLVTIRPTAFEAANPGQGAAPLVTITPEADSGLSTFISRQQPHSDRPDLATAKIVVSGGRGLGSAEKFQALIEPLADKLGAAIGASRAAVDEGFTSNDHQVGQTGKIVAPQLYIAIGVSGAIQHLAGIMGAKTIVAINQDADAPIFQVADYGLVGDLFTIVPELTSAL